MRKTLEVTLPVCLFGVYMLWITGSAGTAVPEISDACLRCLCYVATKCDMAHECTGGYCGPFNISRIYWIESGKIGMDEDGPEETTWTDCALNYQCSKKIIRGYVQRFGAQDCNDDGKIDCFDYMMLNANGGYGCTQPLNRSATGRTWLKRYEECRL